MGTFSQGSFTGSPGLDGTLDAVVPTLTVVLAPGTREPEADLIAQAISQLRGVDRVTRGAMAHVRELQQRIAALEAELQELRPPPMAGEAPQLMLVRHEGPTNG